MTGAEFLGLGLVVLAAFGWWQALTAQHEHNHEIDLPSAYQRHAWEKQRLIRAEGNRRMS